MDYVKALVEMFLAAVQEYFKHKEPQSETTSPAETQKLKQEITMIKISKMPYLGENGDHVNALQTALNKAGAHLTVDNDFGPKTTEAVSVFQKSHGLEGSGILGPISLKLLGLEISVVAEQPKTKAPWFWWAKKYEGKTESDSTFNKFMAGFWSKVGLPGYKTISGSAFAWCGLTIAAALVSVGIGYQKDGAGAKNWDKFGQSIEWRVNGFPQGAVVRINHSANCKSASGNHVTMANGDCSAADIIKSGASFSGFGGNQGNALKVSTYPVAHICSVRWPNEQPLPGKITKSLNCSNGQTSNESTR